MRKCWWVLLLLVACKKPGHEGPVNQLAGQKKAMRDALMAPAARGPGFATAPAGPAPAASGPGVAILHVQDVGLVTIAVDGTVTTQPIEPSRVDAIALARDGAVLVSSMSGVFRVKDGTAAKLTHEAFDGPSGGHLAVAPDGKVWVATAVGLFGWDGTAWTKLATEQPLSDVVVDSANHVYAAGGTQIGVASAGGAWQVMLDVKDAPHEGVIERPRFDELAVAGKQLVAVDRYGFVKLDGTTVEAVRREPMDPMLGWGRVLGSDYVGLLDGGAILKTPLAGGPDLKGPLKTPITGAQHVTVDGGGRLWVATLDNGLAIVSPDGAVTSWPVGSIPAISGTVDAIFVAGTGPTKLPVPGAIAKGTIVGKVTNKGTPIAKAYVEACQIPLDPEKDVTPCQNRPIHGSTTTDESGAFSIAGLPLQDYTIVIRDGEQWYELLGRTCAGMSDGGTCDVGELDVTRKPDYGLPSP